MVAQVELVVFGRESQPGDQRAQVGVLAPRAALAPASLKT